MFIRKRANGYYYLVEKIGGREKYILSLGKDPTRYEAMIKEGKELAVMLKENPILANSLGAARERLKSAARNFQLKRATIKPIPIGDVYYADPPWKYDFSETITREIENQYPTMELAEIQNLPMPDVPDSALFLWATAPKLIEALAVMEAWGYRYKTNLVWDKEKIGMGYWFRGKHELLLVGTKGAMSPPAASNRIASVYREARGEHSVKPIEIHSVIESMLPGLRYVELFARSPYSDKWQVWGNEIEGVRLIAQNAHNEEL